MTSVAKLFIEFGGQQLEVVTDIPAFRAFFVRTYCPMLVPALTSSAGRLEAFKKGAGYVIRGRKRSRSMRRARLIRSTTTSGIRFSLCS